MEDIKDSHTKPTISQEALKERKAFLDLSSRDVTLLGELGEKLDMEAAGVIDDFYDHLLSAPTPRALLETHEAVDRLKELQAQYFQELTGGVYDSQYINKRLQVGWIHQKMGLEPHWYLIAYQYFLGSMHDQIEEIYEDDPSRGRAVYAALRKIVFFDMSLAIDTYIRVDRRRAQASEQGFRDVIEHSPDGVVIHRDEMIVYVNPVLVDLLKYEDHQILGRSIFEFIHDTDETRIHDQIRRLRETGRPRAMVETTLIRSGDKRLEAEISSVPLHFDGEPAIVSMVRDITDRKKFDARMMRMDRMIAAGTLAAGVGHEINNPLTYISTNLGFALRQLDEFDDFQTDLQRELRRRLGEREADDLLDSLSMARHRQRKRSIKEALEDAQHGSRRIRDIVGQLRNLARNDGDDSITFEPRKTLEWAINMASNEIRHRARLVLDFTELPTLRGKESRLGQVFLNLIINAAHAIEEGAVDENEIRISSGIADGGMVYVDISDTGKGIAPEHLERIFDPFFTTKDVGEGTGLGLHICQSIIDSYGGRIEVESEPGTGSRFRVYLPICVTDASEKPRHADQDAHPRSEESKGRILIVDDEGRFRNALFRILQHRHHVTLADSGEVALRYLELEQHFDLILCDMMMPKMTGMDFYEALERNHPRCTERVVFMSGGAFTQRSKEFLEHTENLYIEKPFERERLLELLTELIEH